MPDLKINNNKTTVILQARVNSSRLPGKVLKLLGKYPMLLFQIERIKKCKLVDEIIVATTIDKSDDKIEKLCLKNGIKFFRGSVDDVLKRYKDCLSSTKSETLIRITGDCPIVDPDLVDLCIRRFQETKCDYLCNNYPPTYPDGLDVEVFTRDVLLLADKMDTNIASREHVTPWIRNSKLNNCYTLKCESDLSEYRWTVDEPEDLLLIREIVKHFNYDINFSWENVLKLIKDKPKLIDYNKNFNRNEGAKMNRGQKIWRRAKRVIPGGNMLLSKRSEMFLPDNWPSYFSSAKGYEVIDLDGNIFIDMSIMGIGTNILGYGNEEVDKAVIETVKSGNMSTFNCYEEVLLAEKLIELHPWANMAKFARTGGEANALAIRIARASTGKDKVAICGYHGWHDWYLATNLSDESLLSEHLLPGLSAKGIPSDLNGTVIPFSYNNLEELRKILDNNECAAVKMEVERSVPPTNDFLDGVRDLCDAKNVILIFDECTSGFRETFGGLHKKYDVEPDMSVFGKALGNGYAITAVIGKENIMQAAQETFISSTFWTERIGPTAALKTLEIMEAQNSWVDITSKGLFLKKQWKELAEKYSLEIHQNGIPSLAGFNFQSNNSLSYKTLITQEMLKKGYLASNVCYVSTEHTEDLIRKYIKDLDPIFCKIAECEDGRNISDLLEGPICHAGFKRLN
tara:strand:+ start:6447 stop:8498 length:2052 start_codon:yes stop_codon:yes gene_type:complete